MVKNLSTMRKTWVQSLGWEDLLEKGMATHSSILAWRIPWIEEPGELQSMESQRVGHDWAANITTHRSKVCNQHLINRYMWQPLYKCILCSLNFIRPHFTYKENGHRRVKQPVEDHLAKLVKSQQCWLSNSESPAPKLMLCKALWYYILLPLTLY